MNETTQTEGFAILCSHLGDIQQVIRDDFGWLAAEPAPRTLYDLFDQASTHKLIHFLGEVRRLGAAFDWVLNGLDETAVLLRMHLHGCRLAADRCLIIATYQPADADALYDDMMQIQNEQIARLRRALKARPGPAVPASSPDDVVEDLMRLNNELSNLQRSLAKQNAELEQLNQLKNQFLGMAAHDLRHPICSIQEYSQFLLEQAVHTQNEAQVPFLSVIATASRELLGSLDSMLDLSALEAGKPDLHLQPTNLTELVRQNIVLNEALAHRKQISITLDEPVPLPSIPVDRRKIEQVLNNLLSNAIKFSYPDTTITVRLQRLAEEIVVSVTDQGQGIPLAEQDKLFHPFSKTSIRATQGESSTGLGLAISRRIVEAHNGRIWVASRHHEGATFAFALPLAPRST
ncbi:MAG: HAMP domain-containing histidine kinase [Anaerolineales bacterium]|nr:HAMP domain-containing histidine kinase [Anaerolineales bacterium]